MTGQAAEPQIAEPQTVERMATEAEVAALVHGFYDRVRADRLLGPLFEIAIADWPAHLAVIEDFWSRVLRGTDRYRGCVMGAHGGMRLQPAHFDRWLALFRQSAEQTLPPAACQSALATALFIDQRLRAGLTGR